MPLNSGTLRHRVNIQSKTVAQDALTGEMEETWATTHANIPCSIEPLSAREFMQSQSEQSGISARVVIRHRTGMDSTMRLVGTCGCHLDRVYNPAGWLEDKESGRLYMTAPCSEGVNEG